MEFCEKCKSILIPAVDGGKHIIKCPRCGDVVSKRSARITIKETLAKEKVGAGVSDKEVHTMAEVTLDQPCEKCGNTTAFHRSEQTRASDEPETEFFTCTKCKFTWREYA